MATFGDRFKLLRKEQNLTQQEIADKINNKYNLTFGKSAVSQYENNKRFPEIFALEKFADYFNVSIDFLIGRSEIRNIKKIIYFNVFDNVYTDGVVMNRIKLLRKEKNLTQADLGKLLNVSDRSVGFYENEKRDPDTDTLKILADFFEVSLDYLLGRTNIRNQNEIIYSNAFHSISDDGLTKEDIDIVKAMIEQLKKKNK